MARELPVNIDAVDQFPVFDFDGINKKSGLGASDFDVKIYKDGALQGAYSYTISEIGTTGDYKIEWIPGSVGYWVIEVYIQYNYEWWGGEYDVFEGSQTDIYEMVRRALGLIHENIFIDETVYNVNNQLVSARVRVFDSKTDCDNATDGGNPPVDPEAIATYQVTTEWEGINKYKIFKQTLEP